MTPPDSPHQHPVAKLSTTRVVTVLGALFFTLVLIGLGQATGTVQFHGDTWRPPAADAALPPDPLRHDRPAVVPTAPPVRAALPSTF